MLVGFLENIIEFWLESLHMKECEYIRSDYTCACRVESLKPLFSS